MAYTGQDDLDNTPCPNAKPREKRVFLATVVFGQMHFGQRCLGQRYYKSDVWAKDKAIYIRLADVMCSLLVLI